MTRFAPRVVVMAARVAPAALTAVMLVLTVLEQSYLDEAGWSAVHRTPVAWPSILALGPGGWALTAGFAVSGLLGVAIGLQLTSMAPSGLLRIAASLFVVLNVALVLVGFSADAPDARVSTWHGTVHDAAYLLLVTMAVSSMLLMSLTRSLTSELRRLRTGSRIMLPVVISGLVVTNVDSVAQLGRYILLAGVLAWAHIVARAAARGRD